jgi:hypothetical protein
MGVGKQRTGKIHYLKLFVFSPKRKEKGLFVYKYLKNTMELSKTLND